MTDWTPREKRLMAETLRRHRDNYPGYLEGSGNVCFRLDELVDVLEREAAEAERAESVKPAPADDAPLYRLPAKYSSSAHEPVGFTLADVRRLYMRLWLRHTHKGDDPPDVPWSPEDDAALRACAAVVKGE